MLKVAHPPFQVEDVCKTLAGFPELKDGYNAVGFSQGKASLALPRNNHIVYCIGIHPMMQLAHPPWEVRSYKV